MFLKLSSIVRIARRFPFFETIGSGYNHDSHPADAPRQIHSDRTDPAHGGSTGPGNVDLVIGAIVGIGFVITVVLSQLQASYLPDARAPSHPVQQLAASRLRLFEPAEQALAAQRDV